MKTYYLVAWLMSCTGAPDGAQCGHEAVAMAQSDAQCHTIGKSMYKRGLVHGGYFCVSRAADMVDFRTQWDDRTKHIRILDND